MDSRVDFRQVTHLGSPLQRRLVHVLGLGAVGVAIFLLLQTPQLELSLFNIAVWLTCLALFMLSDIMAGRIEGGLWAGYLNVSVMVAWLTLGLGGALAVILIGAPSAAIIDASLNINGERPAALRERFLEITLSRITISSLALLTASTIFSLLGGSVPFYEIDIHTLAALAALFGGFVATQVAGVLLVGQKFTKADIMPSLGEQIGRLSIEMLLLGLSLALTLILFKTGLVVFIGVMLMVGILAARYRQLVNTQQSLERRVQELSMLNRIGQAVSSNLMLDDLLMNIYEQVSQLIDISTFYVALYDDEQGTLEFRLVVSHGRKVKWQTRRLRAGGTHDYIIHNRQPLRMNISEPERNAQLEITLLTQRYVAYVGVPLMIGAKVLGVMAIISDEQPNAFGQTEIDTLQTVASQAGLAIRNATLYTRSSELAQQLALINNSVQTLLFNLDSTEAMNAACETAIKILDAQRAGIYTLEAEVMELHLAHSINFTPDFRERYQTLPYEPDLYHDGPRLVADIEEAKDLAIREQARHGKFRAFAEIPLRSGNVILGLMVIYHDIPHYHRKTELNMLSALANQVTAALDNAQLLQALELYASEMGQLMHLSRISTSSLQLHQVVADIEAILCDMMNVSRTTLALREAGGESMRVISDTITKETPATLMQFPELRMLSRQPVPKPCAFQRDDSEISAGLAALMDHRNEQWLALIPMVTNNDLLGVIVLGDQSPRFLTSREWQLLETATNQIATQVYNAQVYSITRQELNQRLEQLSLIEDIAQQISSALDLNEIIHNVLEAAISSTHADIAALALLTESDEFWIIKHEYFDGELKKSYYSRDNEGGVIGEVTRRGTTLIVPDNRAIEYYVPAADTHYLSSIAVPLLKEAKVIGVLNLESRELNVFTQEQASFLNNLARHAVISIENARLLEERGNQVETLTSLRELSLNLSSVTDTYSVAHAVLETALRMSESHKAAIYRYDDSTGQLVSLVGLTVRKPDSPFEPMQRYMPNRVVYRAFETGEIQVAERLVRETETLSSDPPQYSSMIAVPIKRQGQVREVLTVAFNTALSFSETDLNTLSLLAIQAAGHLENATLHEHIWAASNRMRAILDSTREGIILLDTEGHLVDVNIAAEQLLGINLNEYVGESFIAILTQNTPSGEAIYSVDQIAETARLLQAAPEHSTRREFQYQRLNEIKHLEEIGAPVRDSQDRIMGRLLVIRDITEEKLLAAYRDEIINMAVHDLRGPLSSIINGVQIALEDVDKPEQLPLVNQTLTLALNGAYNLMNLVNTMLEIAKLKRRQLPLRREPLPIEWLIKSALDTLSSSIHTAAIEAEVIVPSELEVYVDEDKVRRVLVNLIDNAVRYTPTGGKIQISAVKLDLIDQVRVFVADTGTGIPPEDHERVFDDFVQVKGAQRVRGSKGTGLGLTFCKLAVEAHEGQIWVEANGPLSGACLAFTLPIATEADVKVEEALPMPRAATTSN